MLITDCGSINRDDYSPERLSEHARISFLLHQFTGGFWLVLASPQPTSAGEGDQHVLSARQITAYAVFLSTRVQLLPVRAFTS